jgi:hypothetical protein
MSCLCSMRESCPECEKLIAPEIQSMIARAQAHRDKLITSKPDIEAKCKQLIELWRAMAQPKGDLSAAILSTCAQQLKKALGEAQQGQNKG